MVIPVDRHARRIELTSAIFASIFRICWIKTMRGWKRASEVWNKLYNPGGVQGW